MITSDCSFRKRKGGREGEEKTRKSDKTGLELQRRGKEGGTQGKREGEIMSVHIE